MRFLNSSFSVSAKSARSKYNFAHLLSDSNSFLRDKISPAAS